MAQLRQKRPVDAQLQVIHAATSQLASRMLLIDPAAASMRHKRVPGFRLARRRPELENFVDTFAFVNGGATARFR